MRFHKRFYLPATVAAAALLAACAGGMAAKSWTPNVWPAGTTVTYEIFGGQTQTMDVPGAGSQTVNMTSSAVYNVTATGEREFQIKVTDASQSSDMGDPSEAGMPDVSELIGLETTVRLGDNGDIVEATNLEDHPYIVEMMGAEAYKNDLQDMFLRLPEGELKPGVEWTKTLNIPISQMGLELTLETADNYKCLEVTTFEGTPAFKISVSGIGTLGGGGETQGMMVDLQLTGKGEGTIYVSTKDAMVLMAESKTSMEGGFAAQGMDIPMTMLMTGTIKVKK